MVSSLSKTLVLTSLLLLIPTLINHLLLTINIGTFISKLLPTIHIWVNSTYHYLLLVTTLNTYMHKDNTLFHKYMIQVNVQEMASMELKYIRDTLVLVSNKARKKCSMKMVFLVESCLKYPTIKIVILLLISLNFIINHTACGVLSVKLNTQLLL
jgi:hypothetical protein